MLNYEAVKSWVNACEGAEVFEHGQQRRVWRNQVTHLGAHHNLKFYFNCSHIT